MKYIAADAIVNGKIDAFHPSVSNYLFTVIANFFGSLAFIFIPSLQTLNK
jgi:hypothetical protein